MDLDSVRELLRKVKTYPRGESHPSSTLTKNEVLKIFRSSRSTKWLATKYSVSEATVYAIRNRKTWRHLTCFWDYLASKQVPRLRLVP